MKKKTMLFLVTGVLFISQIIAQQSPPGRSTGSNQDKRSCGGSITSLDNGLVISFFEEKLPRDAATGQATGKRQHKPFSFMVSSTDNSVTEVKTNKVVTGQATSSDRASYSGLKIKLSKPNKDYSVDPYVETTMRATNYFNLPTGLDDGEYDLGCSWSWGVSNSGSMREGKAMFKIEIKNGSCFGINEQGVK